jgi:hypothetical protein
MINFIKIIDMKAKTFVIFMISFTVCSNVLWSQKKLMADSVFRYICMLGIKHPEIVIKQSILETGWYKSPFLMKKNNLFGFRKRSYMNFSNWKESVVYYKKWQDKNYRNTKEDYYDFLVRIKYPYHLKQIKYNNICN